MKRILFLVTASCFFFNSCNDGDIILSQLEFDNTYKECGNVVFYKTKTEPFESLSLQLTSPAFKFDEFITNAKKDTTNYTYQTVYIIDDAKNKLNYRTYSINPNSLFCNDIPPADLGIIADTSSPTGEAIITGTLIADDNDGIPSKLEDINKDGNLKNDDTDGDGLPNYIDSDDDGDNVLTKDEGITYDAEKQELTAKDTDGDKIPDYLDTDDDGDGVLTRDEENTSQDQDPTNDTTLNQGADYLNPKVNDTVPATKFREHIYNEVLNLDIQVIKITLKDIRLDEFNFGKLEGSPNTIKEIKVTPEFK